uniref:Uncharacterized protein n=2 Tax=Tetranychus urticae TaxID=32264 RepID=T1KDG5_TETUR
MISALHFEVVSQTPGLMAFTVVMIFVSGFCVVSSVFLIIGLCVESKALLAPWLIAIIIATALDFIFTIFSLLDGDLEIDSYFVFFALLSICTCLLNIYSIFVVTSQYQLYRKDSKRRMESISTILEKIEAPSKSQTEKIGLENSNTSYQLYNDDDHDDGHSNNPSHASFVSSEILAVSSCKPNCCESCECITSQYLK